MGGSRLKQKPRPRFIPSLKTATLFGKLLSENCSCETSNRRTLRIRLKNMGDVDVSEVVVVPDTPNSLVSQNNNGIEFIRRGDRLSSMVNRFENSDISDDGWRNKNKRATKTESGSMFISNNSELQGHIRKIASRTTPHSKSAFHPNGNAVDDTFNHGGKNNIRSKHMGERRANSSSQFQMPACQGRSNVIDLTKHDGHSNVCQNSVAGSSQGDQHRKEMVDRSFSPMLVAEDSDIEEIYEKPRTSQRTQKRLVKNGCISPLDVAKAKQSAQKHSNTFLHLQQDDSRSSRELKAEEKDSRRSKGKGLLAHNILSEESDEKGKPLCGRTLAGKLDGVSPTKACVLSEEASGWISTRKRTRKLDPFLSDEEHLCRQGDDTCNVTKLPGNVVVRRDNEDGSNARKHSVSSQNVSVAPISHTLSQKRQGCLLNEHHDSSNTAVKRQKQHSPGTHHCESSSSPIGNSEVSGFWSSGEPSNVRSVRTQTSHTASRFNRIVGINDFSPGSSNSSHNVDCSRNSESDVRVIQMEEDEIMATELQEQLYNESNAAADREIDEQIALELQQGSFQHTSPRGSHHESHPTSSFISNLHGQYLSQSSQNSSTHRVTQARVPTPTRMPRPRRRFPAQPRTVSSRRRNFPFPPSMDVDTRMHFLEALVFVNNIGVASGLLQFQRDFNENDYEMLLALDENNHQHCGASAAQINVLPESTVQTDDLEECSVCLETPSIGDTMRHLPCLHRFHKDCIDEWLRRRTSCPICKSSIT